MSRTSLLGNINHPTRRMVTMAVLDQVNADPIEAALYYSERRSIEDDRPISGSES